MADANDQPIETEPAPIKEEEKPDLFEDIPEDIRNDSVDSIKTRSRMIDNEIRVGRLSLDLLTNNSYRCSNLSNYV